MSKLINELDQASMRSDLPAFRPGDTVKYVKVVEGTRSRIQVFTGVVISRAGDGIREAFTVRKVSFGVGVERTFRCTARSSTRSRWNAAATYAGQSSTTCEAVRGKAAKIKEKRDAQLIAGNSDMARWVRPTPRRALQPVAEPESDELESPDSDPDHLSFRPACFAFFKELTGQSSLVQSLLPPCSADLWARCS